jgi:hypothetical protein
VNLVLNLKAEYFDAIKAGAKVEEFRVRNEYWSKRIVGRNFDNVILRKGYPKAGDPEREIILPWRGYREITLTHPHFGNDPVDVFAINVGK